MVARIQKDVAERAAHLDRRAKQPYVVTIGEHAAVSLRKAIHRAREPGRDRHHPTSEGLAIVRLDDQVGVVPL